jgi:hypothetical protein
VIGLTDLLTLFIDLGCLQTQRAFNVFKNTLNDLVIALRPQTPKHIRGGWSQYTDTSEPVDGGVGTLQLRTTRTILSVKMDRQN